MSFWTGFAKRAAADKAVSTVAVVRGGKLLMGRRRDNGRWTCPGGHLEDHEDPLMGAVRELREESGLEADPKQLSHLKTVKVVKPDGGKLTVHAYCLHLGGAQRTTMRGDPDGEVHRWHWVNYAGGLSAQIAGNLHVPMERNVLMKALGADRADAAAPLQKAAFWRGFGPVHGVAV
jgi:8-oxo-dGTP pyrophosphatase MutT (NUDIX family)